MRVARGRVAPVPTPITERNWRREGREKGRSRKEERGRSACVQASLSRAAGGGTGLPGGRSMCFLTGAVSPPTLLPGCRLSTGAGARPPRSRSKQASPLWPQPLLRAPAAAAGDKTDGGWDNEVGRSAPPDGPAVGVGASLTLRTGEVCRSAGRREPALS